MDTDTEYALQRLAAVIKDAVSREVRPPQYLAGKQKDIHIFMWSCRCWVKFRGSGSLPEGVRLDDVWELSVSMNWQYLEEGSCSAEHGSDGRFVSPLDSHVVRPPVMTRPQEAFKPVHRLPTSRPVMTLPKGCPVTRRELRAKHDEVVAQLIEIHQKASPDGGT